jgi:hypothetical protein
MSLDDMRPLPLEALDQLQRSPRALRPFHPEINYFAAEAFEFSAPRALFIGESTKFQVAFLKIGVLCKKQQASEESVINMEVLVYVQNLDL